REAFKSQRCLVPADGFYEWKATSSGKQPHLIWMQNNETFFIAGLWESWASPDGTQVETCALITTRANEGLAAIHDRMPVVVRRESLDFWLARSVTNPAELKALLMPYPAAEMIATRVRPIVNTPRHDSAACLEAA